MTIADNEMRALMREHEAIRRQMKFLTDSLIGLSTQSIPVKDLLRRYRLNLRDFEEIVQGHIELDEHIFKALPGSNLSEHLINEHEEIRKQVASVILLAEIACENKAEQGELEPHALAIREAVNRLCDLIKAHTVKEDELFQRMQQHL